MSGEPSAGDVVNNANGMQLDSRTPGLNSFLVSWSSLQDFTNNWATSNYNQTTNVAALTGELFT